VKITRIKTVHTVEVDESRIYRRVEPDKWMAFSESNWLMIDNPSFVEKLEALFQEEIGK
jgi:hypothetical protein